MSKVYIAFERLTGLFAQEKTVYVPFDGDSLQAEAHLKSDEFFSFLNTSKGFNPRIVIRH